MRYFFLKSIHMNTYMYAYAFINGKLVLLLEKTG